MGKSPPSATFLPHCRNFTLSPPALSSSPPFGRPVPPGGSRAVQGHGRLRPLPQAGSGLRPSQPPAGQLWRQLAPEVGCCFFNMAACSGWGGSRACPILRPWRRLLGRPLHLSSSAYEGTPRVQGCPACLALGQRCPGKGGIAAWFRCWSCATTYRDERPQPETRELTLGPSMPAHGWAASSERFGP